MKQILLFLFLAWGCWSCAPVYVPTRNNVPMFSKKGEVQASVSVGSGLNLQAAYAISHSLGVTINYLHHDFNDDNNFQKEHHIGEIGLGYYKNLENNWYVDCFLGYGKGKGNVIDTASFLSSNSVGNVRYQKFFIQPSFGGWEGKIKWNVSLKASLIDYEEMRLIINSEPVHAAQSKVFLTPAITISRSLYKEHIVGTLQSGFNFHLGQSTKYDYEFFMASIGLMFRLGQKRN